MVGTVLITRTKVTPVDAPFLTPWANAMTLLSFGMKAMTGWMMIGTPAQLAEIGTKKTPTKSQLAVAVRMQNFIISRKKREKKA